MPSRDQCEVVLPELDGRECVPVRLLPFLTNWRPLSPDRITELLGAGEPLRGLRWRISAYILRKDATRIRVLPAAWARLTEKLAVLAFDLRRSEEFEGQNNDEWERRSVAMLPAACFVWRDELEAEYERTFRNHAFIRLGPGAKQLSEAESEAELAALTSSTDPAEIDGIQERALEATTCLEGDGSLHFAPLLTEAEHEMAFEGFGLATGSGTLPLGTGEIDSLPATKDRPLRGHSAEPHLAWPSAPTDLVYWRQVLYQHMDLIDAPHDDNATAHQAIAYLKALGDKRLRYGGPIDRLVWMGDNGDPKTVKAKTVGNALPTARAWRQKNNGGR